MTTANGGGAANGHGANGNGRGAGGLDRDAFLGAKSRMTFNRAELEGLVANALTMRRDWLTRMGDPRRDIAAECGYPSSVRSYSAWEYQDLYDKDPIAERVVNVMPKECWQVQPLVYETDDPEVVTPFEQAWDDLGKGLRGEKSWYKDEEGSPVWDYLLRADVLSGIGHFGVILLGIDDGQPLDVPAEGVMPDEVEERPVDAPPRPGNPAMASQPVVPEKQETGVPERQTEGQAPGQQASVASTPKDKAAAPVKPSAEPLPPIKPAGSSTAAVPPKDPDPYRNPTGLFAGTDAQYRGGWSPPDPAAPAKKDGGKRKLLYLRVFPESLVEIVQFESNFQSPRFGQPVMYNITMNDPRAGQHSGIGLPLSTMRVHWTRVIHVVDGVATSEVFGVPRMRPVLLRLLDLQKVYGGDAEAFWKNCFSGDTKFFDGHVLRELQDCVGEEVTVVCADGRLRKATVEAFGKRPVVDVVLKPKDGRNTNFRRTFRATPDHRWVLEDGTVTENLKPGDVLAANHFPEDELPEDPAGFAHGFVFGDGSMKTGRSHYFTLRLCGKKRRWFDALRRTAHVANESVASMGGDPHLVFVSREVNLKALPATDEHSEAYVRSFIEGWLAADGNDVNGISRAVSTQDASAAEWFFANGPRHGFEVTGHTVVTRPTNYGPRSAPLNSICYRRERQGYRVAAIVDRGEVEETFCVVEPETGTFTLEGGVVTGNCLMKLLFETHPQLGGEVDVDLSAMRDMMENFGNGLQGWMYLSGMSGKSVAPSVVDPTAHINVQIEAICIEKEIPIRVFKGSERGELASSQDDAAWNDKLRNRQRTHVTPRLIIPFVDRLIAMKVLPEPKGAPPKPVPGAIDPVTGKPVPGIPGTTGQGQVGPDGKPLTGPDGKPVTGPDGKPAAPGRPAPFGPKSPGPKPGVAENEEGAPAGRFPPKRPAFNAPSPPANPFARKPAPGGPPRPGSSPVSRGQGRPPFPSPQEDAGAAADELDDTAELGGGLDDPQRSIGQAVEEEKGYRVEWPDLTSQTSAEKAAVLGQKTAAYAQYVSGGLEAVIPPLTYMTQFDDFTEEEAQSILESAEADAAMAEQEEMAKQAQMIEQGLVPDPTDPEQVAAHNPPPVVGGPPGAGGPPKPGPGGPPKPGGGFPPKGGPPGAKPGGGNPFGKPPGGKPPQFNSQGPAPNTWTPVAPANFAGNAFCPTGEGGGVDPTCGGEGGPGPSPSPRTKAPDPKELELAIKVPLTGAASPTSVQKATVGGKDWAIKLKDGDEEANRRGAEVEQEVTSLAAEAGVKVAQTFAMRVGFSEAAVSEFIPGQAMAKMSPAQAREALSNVPKEEVDRQVLFDYAVGFSDGHDGNYVVSDGSLTGIDKEYSLGTENGGAPGAYWSKPTMLNHLGPEGSWTARPLDQGEVRSMAAKAGKMAESLRSRGKEPEAAYVEARADVLRRLSGLDNPTMGDLDRIAEQADAGRRGGSVFERTKDLLKKFVV